MLSAVLATLNSLITLLDSETGLPLALVDGNWVTVKRTRLNANSTALFSASLLPDGTSTIRVAMSVNQAGPGYLGGFSRQLTHPAG